MPAKGAFRTLAVISGRRGRGRGLPLEMLKTRWFPGDPKHTVFAWFKMNSEIAVAFDVLMKPA